MAAFETYNSSKNNLCNSKLASMIKRRKNKINFVRLALYFKVLLVARSL